MWRYGEPPQFRGHFGRQPMRISAVISIFLLGIFAFGCDATGSGQSGAVREAAVADSGQDPDAGNGPGADTAADSSQVPRWSDGWNGPADSGKNQVDAGTQAIRSVKDKPADTAMGGAFSLPDDKPDAAAGTDVAADPVVPACPNAPPASGLAPPAPPLPDESSCVWPASYWASETANKATPFAVSELELVLGKREFPGDPFATLVDGDWLGMHHGPQGSFHAFAAFRLTIPGSKGTNRKVELDAWLADGCTVRAAGAPPQVWLWPVAGQPGQWGNTEEGDAGAMLYFNLPSAESGQFCNQWTRLYVRLRDPLTGLTAESSRLLRLYDTVP